MGAKAKTMAFLPFHLPERCSSQRLGRAVVLLLNVPSCIARIQPAFGDLPRRVAAVFLVMVVGATLPFPATAMTLPHGMQGCAHAMASMNRAVPRKSTIPSTQPQVQHRPAPCCTMGTCSGLAGCSATALPAVTVSAMNPPHTANSVLWELHEFRSGVTWQPDRPPPIG